MRAKRKHFGFQGVQILPDRKYKRGKCLRYKNAPSFNRKRLLLEKQCKNLTENTILKNIGGIAYAVLCH